MAAFASAPARQVPAQSDRLTRHLLPSYSDLFLLALLVWMFSIGDGWNSLLLDADTGWHIRTGDHIRTTGSVPGHDLFSFSKAGQPWFAWEWLSDVVFSFLHAHWGLAGVVALGGILISLTATLLLRQMIFLGADTFVSLGLTLLFLGAASLHYHARPHLFTLVFLTISSWLLARDRRQQDHWIWILVPLTALWTNLHGGFLVLIALLGIAAVGKAIEDIPRRTWAPALRYLGLTAACAAASLVNPYGYQLHVHVYEYLRSDFIRNVVQEFQSPVFRSEGSLQYEVILLAGIACAGLLLRRRQWVSALSILYFAHASLSAARHVPLYVIVAAPLIALEVTYCWTAWAYGHSKQSVPGILTALSKDFGAGFRRTTFWAPVGLVLLFSFTPGDKWPRDFAKLFPDAIVAKHRDRIAASRVFTTDQWGDYLIYHFYPGLKVFIDGRSDFYGEKLGNEYIDLMNPDHRWKSIVDRHGFTLMLLPVKWPLVSVLKLSPEWQIIADDGMAVLIARRNSQKIAYVGLMERIANAESTRRDSAK